MYPMNAKEYLIVLGFLKALKANILNQLFTLTNWIQNEHTAVSFVFLSFQG